MAKNYMKYIANLFGLELGEKFKLLYPNGDEREEEYIITESGGLKRTDSGFFDCTDTLMCMLKGCYDIKKLPWKPEYDEMYYFPDISAGIPAAGEDDWGENAVDYNRYEAGMVCKTEVEARKKSEKMLAVLKGEQNV